MTRPAVPPRPRLRARSRAASALVASISRRRSGSRPLSSLVADCDEQQLVDLAIAEGLAGPASERLGPLLSPGPRSRLMGQVRLETTRNLAYLAVLANVGGALDDAAVEWAVLKGPALAEVGYAGGPRGYTDLDLLVAPHHLEAAIRAMAAAGVPLGEEDWPRLSSELKGQVSLTVAGAPLVDLHWHPVYLRSARERFRIPTEALLERRQPIRLQGVNAWTLEPTDFAIHVALHASFAGAHRLRRLLDIDRTVVHHPPDWDLVVGRCQAWRTALPVGVMLESSRRTVGAPVPDEVLRGLAGGGLDRLAVRRLSAWIPSGRLPGGRSVRTGLTRCLRDGWPSTGAEFAGEALRLATSRLRAQPPGGGDPVDPAQDEGCERYFAMVSRTDRYGHLAEDRSDLAART